MDVTRDQLVIPAPQDAIRIVVGLAKRRHVFLCRPTAKHDAAITQPAREAELDAVVDRAIGRAVAVHLRRVVHGSLRRTEVVNRQDLVRIEDARERRIVGEAWHRHLERRVVGTSHQCAIEQLEITKAPAVIHEVHRSAR